MLLILKFGGTSVQDAAAIERLQEIVLDKKGKRVVVVSALSGVTDSLLAISNCAASGRLADALFILKALEERHLKIISNLDLCSLVQEEFQKSVLDLLHFLEATSTLGEVSLRSNDHIISHGELWSSKIIFNTLKKSSLHADWVDARRVIKTNSNFGSAAVNFDLTQKMAEHCLSEKNSPEVLVLGGFIGSDEINQTTTLGRGGSDYSASVLGSVLKADAIEIWTDVDGVMTADPRVVPSARRIKRLSFDEAAELAFFGAKVLHPATIFPAIQAKIPVWVYNSKNPKKSGTVITDQALSDPNIVKALTCKKQIMLINIYSTRMLGASGFLKKVFDVFAELGISIDSISTSEVNLSLTVDFTIDPNKQSLLLEKLSQYSRVTIETEKSSVAIVGHGIRHASGIAARIFKALAGFNVSMISMGSSEVNINLVVDRTEVDAVILKLHEEFFKGHLNVDVFA